MKKIFTFLTLTVLIGAAAPARIIGMGNTGNSRLLTSKIMDAVILIHLKPMEVTKVMNPCTTSHATMNMDTITTGATKTDMKAG